MLKPKQKQGNIITALLKTKNSDITKQNQVPATSLHLVYSSFNETEGKGKDERKLKLLCFLVWETKK